MVSTGRVAPSRLGRVACSWPAEVDASVIKVMLPRLRMVSRFVSYKDGWEGHGHSQVEALGLGKLSLAFRMGEPKT